MDRQVDGGLLLNTNSQKNKDESIYLSFDDFLVRIGEIGPYQRWLFFFGSLIGVVAALNNMGIVFLAAQPDHWCRAPDLANLSLSTDEIKNLTLPLIVRNGEQRYSQCEIFDRNYSANNLTPGNLSTIPCSNGWVYDDNIYTSTIVTQWDLVCEKSVIGGATAASVYAAGLLAGCLFLGPFSDRLGRVRTMVVAVLVMVVFNLLTALSHYMHYIAFIVFRFFVGIATTGGFTAAFVYDMEIVGPTWRTFSGIGIEFFWAFGYVLFAGIAYFIRHWFYLQLFVTVAAAPLIVYQWLLPESPRWLLTKGRCKEAWVTLEKMAAKSGKTVNPKWVIEIENVEEGTYIDLIRTPNIRLISLNLFFNWFTCSFVYYGLSLNSSNLGGNDFVNFLITGAVEIPAYLLNMFLFWVIGRRWILSSTLLVAGASLLLTLAVPTSGISQHLLLALAIIVCGSHVFVGYTGLFIALASVGKFAVAMSFATVYVFSAELYPTIIRNTGVGAGSIFARVGGMLAPLVAELGKHWKAAPMIVFGGFALLAGALTLLLPETRGANLPETLEEGELFARRHKIHICKRFSSRQSVDSEAWNELDAHL